MSSVQTMKSWARFIDSYESLPSSFKPYLKSFADTPSLFPYTVFIPPNNKWYANKTNSTIIYIYDKKIVVLEKIKKDILPICYHLDKIHYIETGTVLLKSWFSIKGTDDGVSTSSTIEYNAVNENLFKPFIESARMHIQKSDDADIANELSKFNYLSSLNYKFMNYARRSIKPGQKVLCIVLQPIIQKKVLQIFNKVFYKKLSCSHIHILTDKELIIIKDGYGNYGGIWTYIPIDKITDTFVTESKDENISCYTLKLANDDHINFYFTFSNTIALNALQIELEKIKLHS
ncbi:hypothetical protein [Petroclostridium sp. X23]|uniref:hypothetical protein n=1 Tax=Petroclostridium sp. X23 TaxID=3045146 RepID=UPI0024ADA8E9|nr:hypothetical protein [Petroclostridium sp. X23]WHH59404.1 hypothetical protein QKW49_01130 [Petroclostridium sp. X23]